MDRRTLGIGILLFFGILSGWGPIAYPNEPRQIPDLKTGSGKVFNYTAKRFGIPILKATIRIENGSSEHGQVLYQILARIESLNFLKFLFRINNRFFSTVEAETCSPVRYMKEINQQGLLVGRKNYVQTLTFDSLNKKIVVEKSGEEKKQEFALSSETFDPLSMFAKYYLKEELHPGQNIHTFIFDGVKMRQMVFYSKKGKVKSKMFGEVEAVCLESSTSFSTFDDREGTIRIWYTTEGKKIPVLIELDLPVGDITFELESMGGSLND
jgi:hypothetical protein